MLAAENYRLSAHAAYRAVERDITPQMVQYAGQHAECIEDYPEDKYAPSCLMLGFDAEGQPLHLQVSRYEGPRLIIITPESVTPVAV